MVTGRPAAVYSVTGQPGRLGCCRGRGNRAGCFVLFVFDVLVRVPNSDMICRAERLHFFNAQLDSDVQQSVIGLATLHYTMVQAGAVLVPGQDQPAKRIWVVA